MKYYINVLRLIATLSVVLLHTSAGVLDNNFNNGQYEFSYGFYKQINQYAVPVFVLISGFLFNNPNKYIDYKLLFTKYVRRIALALLLFGLPMCVIESILFEHDSIFIAICNFVRGHSWSHMWYLYMLICLYLITPIIKPFLIHSCKRDLEVGLCILFMVSSILPSINYYIMPITSWMILPPYIFIYLLGYYLGYVEQFKISKSHLLLLLAIFIVAIVIKVSCNIYDTIYYDVIVIYGAFIIFMLFKKFDSHWKISDQLAKYCFGVYLTHPIWINFAYKYLHVIPHHYYNPWISILFFGICFTILSFATSMVLMKIPFLKKYVL